MVIMRLYALSSPATSLCGLKSLSAVPICDASVAASAMPAIASSVIAVLIGEVLSAGCVSCKFSSGSGMARCRDGSVFGFLTCARLASYSGDFLGYSVLSVSVFAFGHVYRCSCCLLSARSDVIDQRCQALPGNVAVPAHVLRCLVRLLLSSLSRYRCAGSLRG